VEEQERRRGRELSGRPNLSHILPPAFRPLRALVQAAFQVPGVSRLCDALVNVYVPRTVVRRVMRAGYVDVYASTHPDRRTRAYTCPQPSPAGRIDYIFADPHLAACVTEAEVLEDTPTRDVSGASDHRPLLARLRLE
jgi:hypothetical protein